MDFIRENDIQKIIAIDTCDGTESKYYILVQGSLISVSYGFSHLNFTMHYINSLRWFLQVQFPIYSPVQISTRKVEV